MALHFSIDDPSNYSYAYKVDDDGQSFVASAYGDLDCDGVYSTFEMRASVHGEDGPPGSAELTRIQELE